MMRTKNNGGMRRRDFLGRMAVGVAAAGVLPSCATVDRERPSWKPNVIYTFSDEHRWQSMSFTEMSELQTPNMARLAADGIHFTHCISNYPVCSPHRAILMTSRWPYQHGMIDNNYPLDPREMTLGKAFQAAGYTTGYIGKWHLGGVRAEPFGFDLSLIWGNTNTHWNKSKYFPLKGKPVQPKGYNATLMTDQALEFIEQHRKDPFFLMVSWNPPHSNFTDAPKPKKALYPEGSLPYRKNAKPDPKVNASENRPIWKKNDWPSYQGYHAHVSAIDDELGRIMVKLDELGLAEDTILVYSSDHGSMLGSHGVGSKRQPYEESIRVPFCIRWPRVISPGNTSDVLFGSIDIMPTLCGLAGIPAPDTCEGQDFSGIMRGDQGPDPEAQFIMHISKNNASGGQRHPAPLFRGLRTRRYTYAVYPDRPWCLFDNEEDPFQLNNLIDDPGKASLIKELDKTLRDFMRKAEDPLVLPS